MYFLIKITEGLCYLQSKGIIHRDIKPSNIFIKNGEYVLGDFGFCYFIDSPYQEIGYNVGSPLYMSP
jgi:serine/threonine protein kinase